MVAGVVSDSPQMPTGLTWGAPAAPYHGPNNWLQIMASQPTTVTISPSDNLPTTTVVPSPDGGAPYGGPPDGGAPEDLSAPAYIPRSFHLQAGEYIQWNQSGETSGTIIASDKPVAVISGNGAFFVGAGDADAEHEQLWPISALGWEYALAPLGDGTPRRGVDAMKGHVYGVVAAVDGTTLTFDPPDVMPHAPTLTSGAYSVFSTAKPFLVHSQDAAHPFYIAQYLGGCVNDPNTGLCLGGPEMVNVLPPAQYLRSYVFYTDISYQSTSLVVTRVKGANGFQDVDIGCSGAVTGWVDIGSTGKYQSAVVDLQLGGTPNGSCSNGPQTAKSAGAFGITVWGLDQAASYAYPVGGNLATINPVVVQPGAQ